MITFLFAMTLAAPAEASWVVDDARVRRVVAGETVGTVELAPPRPALEFTTAELRQAKDHAWERGEHWTEEQSAEFLALRTGEQVYDEAILVSDLLIVRRDVHVLGDFCHVPRADLVELHTADGRVRAVVDEVDKSHLRGRALSAPAGDWGVLLREESGRIYGVTVIESDGSWRSESLPMLSYASEVRFDGDAVRIVDPENGPMVVSRSL